MSYIGNEPTSVAFLTDTFSGNGSTTAFTLSAAPAGTSSILVAITGVVQDPSTYSVVGTTLTFSPAPPTGTGNISVRFLGIPASGVTTTAYRTVTEFTATAGQTSFSVPSYTPGFIDVYRNGVMLGSADYTATNGLTVVLALGATAGDLIEVISFQVSSVLNAIPASPSSVQTSYLVDGSVTTAKIANSNVTMAKLDTQAQYTGFKNRIINGAMTIDQRNAGASITPTNTASGTYGLDRWATYGSAASKFSVQQDAGAVTPPAGFNDYLGITSLSSYTVGAGEIFSVFQNIEGFNVSDFAFGTTNAQPVTLSFWVRSSLTGTFGGSINNSAQNRSYVFNYTISSANTWEQKTVTISGDTTGTWLITNGVGLSVLFSLGAGSSFSTTPNTWTAAARFSTTGATSVVGTSGATFYITGVQLEKGSTATSFDYRPYGTELALCQRYFELGGNNAPTQVEGGGTNVWISVQYKVNKRATPTFALTNGTNLYLRHYGTAGITSNSAAYVTGYISATSAMVRYSGFSGLTTSSVMFTSGPTDSTPAVDPFSISAEL